MKKLMYFFLFFLLPALLSAQISIGGYNVYYGSLHNHSNVSDGTGSPATAYNYAKNTSNLDFFSLADHSSMITSTEWTTMKNAANSYNEDGVFVAFCGFEWTSSGSYGHVAVINTTDYCTTSSPTNTFSALCTWLNSRDCIAFFNHPGRENSGGIEFSHFSTTPSDKLVGMELWNKSDGFSEYYYNDGYYSGDGGKGYYDEAIARSWKIGASGSEDNHVGNWGNYCNYRMGVLANVKTRADIYAALQARRFFSTLDKNLALSFKVNGSEMGSTVLASTFNVQIQAADGNGETFTQVQLLKNGVVIYTWNPNSAAPNITQSISCSNNDYLYVRVKQADNDEAVSSPIWINVPANLPPAVSITSPANNAVYSAPALITINATATDADGTISKVEFYRGTVKIGEDASSPYTLSWVNVPAGTYVLTAKATDNLGAQTMSAPVTVYVTAQGNVTVSSGIAGGNDDVEESAAGAIYMTSTDIELVYDSYNAAGNQTVGLRFQNLGIPKDATISNAYIQFTVDEVTSGACAVTIKGEASDNSAAFSSATFNVSGRAKTSAAVSWSPVGWSVIGEAGVNQRTPDLQNIIQEIVNRAAYTFASAITFIITGTGTRTAAAYESSATLAAKLFVTYSTAPSVNFTADQTTIGQQGTVHFTDLSTHQPTSWSWSFPGGTPATSTQQNPAVVYNTPGVYTVTLTAANSGGSGTLTKTSYINVVIYPPVADFTADTTLVREGESVTFTDLSSNVPASWYWDFPGGTPSTSTLQNPVVTYNTIGLYPVTLVVTNSAGTATLVRNDYIQVLPPGYCTSQSTDYSGEYINKFTVGTFVNTTTGSYYSDFTGLTIGLQANKKYTVKITPKFIGGKKTEYFKVWIDYNNDLDFDEADENVLTGTKNAEFKTTFTTPANAAGSMRLRVAMKRGAYPDPCETFTYGEVEDYIVSFGNKSLEVFSDDQNFIDNAGTDDLIIYPNPASLILYCEKTIDNEIELRILSLDGQLAMQSIITDETTNLDISKLKPGLYLVSYLSNDKIRTEKLVIY